MTRRGFTLIELLVYLGVLGIVGAGVMSAELVARRSAASESGAIITLDDQRRVAEQFQRDVEGALEVKPGPGGRSLDLRIPATRDGKPAVGKYETVTWSLDEKTRGLLLRRCNSPFKGQDRSGTLSRFCDGLSFRVEGRTVTATVDFATWQNDALLARRSILLRATRRITAEEEKE